MSVSDWILIANLVISGVCVPLVLFFAIERRKQINHLDGCIDEMKRLMMTKVITKEEMSEFRIEVNETITRIRTAISADTEGLHDRLMRLEAPFFRHGE